MRSHSAARRRHSDQRLCRGCAPGVRTLRDVDECCASSPPSACTANTESGGVSHAGGSDVREGLPSVRRSTGPSTGVRCAVVGRPSVVASEHDGQRDLCSRGYLPNRGLPVLALPGSCEGFFRWQGWPYRGCCGEGVEPPCHDACRDAECSLSTMQMPEGETEPDCFYCSVSVLNRCDS